MPNDAKLGLVLGLGIVLFISIVFFRKEPPRASAVPPVKTIAIGTDLP